MAIVARHAATGRDVVLTGRDRDRAAAVAAEVGPNVRGCAIDLGHPEGIAAGLAEVGPVEHLVLSAIDRDQNTASDYDLKRALYLVTLKLVGYTETIHTLIPRFSADAAVVLFGGRAKDRPYPGSTTVTTVNGGISSLINTLAIELAPIRFNAIHPGIVGQLCTMEDIVGATVFLLENRAVNGVNLYVDGGWMLM